MYSSTHAAFGAAFVVAGHAIAGAEGAAVGAGGAGGGTVIVKADVSAGGYSAAVTIGAGGVAVSQDTGGSGGTTSYDDGTNSFSIPGGAGGGVVIDNANLIAAIAGEGVAPTVTGFEQVILSVPGEDGDSGMGLTTAAISGFGRVVGGRSGGSALFGGGRKGARTTTNSESNAGLAGRWAGEGGSGAASINTAAPVAGGDGFRGEITIYEYSA